MSTMPKSKNDCLIHWSDQLETVVFSTEENAALDLIVEGGSENGEFTYVGDVANKINYLNGFLKSGDIILEVQGQKTAGYTQHDVIAWLNHCCKNGNPVVLKIIAGELIVKDLRQYLSFRFPKGSNDHELQTTIRDNLYLRTVPCTTRLPRDGEINGVDYCFLTPEEFMILERSGKLLESGIYEGNHYGTPKPPKENCICVPSNWETNGQLNGTSVLPGAHPSSDGKRRRNRSNVEAMAANNATVVPESLLSTQDNVEVELLCSGKNDPSSVGMYPLGATFDNNLGPLPSHWEKAFTNSGEPYFIDHTTGTSHWLDPRLARIRKKAVEECNEDELPYGWEKIDDSHYGTYYIDHVNRKTQYENPVLQARLAATDNDILVSQCNGFELMRPNNSRIAAEITTKDEEVTYGSNPELPSQSALSLYLPCLPCINDKQERDCKTSPTQPTSKSNAIPEAIDQSQLPGTKSLFTTNPAALDGQFIRTTIEKSSRGFGFTIVGGDDETDEFLQIKCIVLNGPAWQDGKLKPGDVLVYVNDTCVLGYSHEDIVSLFQSFIPGDVIELEVCRGYAMQFDLTDPNNEVVTTMAVRSDVPITNNIKMDAMNDSVNKSHTTLNIDQNSTEVESMNNHIMEKNNPISPSNVDFYSGGSSNSGFFLVHIVKGGNGFGFTIADSVHGQKVKKILDHSRCNQLVEGDILIAINSQLVKETPHSDVVQLLKDCPNNMEAAITVQRGVGILNNKAKSKHQKMEVSRDDTNSSLIISNEDHRREQIATPTDASGNGSDFWNKIPNSEYDSHHSKMNSNPSVAVHEAINDANSPIAQSWMQATNGATVNSNDSLYATVVHDNQHVNGRVTIQPTSRDYMVQSVVDNNANSRMYPPKSNHRVYHHPEDEFSPEGLNTKVDHSDLSGSTINRTANREQLATVTFEHELERAEPLYPRNYIVAGESYLSRNESDGHLMDNCQSENNKNFWDSNQGSSVKPSKNSGVAYSNSPFSVKQELTAPELYSGFKSTNDNIDFHLSSVQSLGECSSEQESTAYGCHQPLNNCDFYVPNQLGSNVYLTDTWRKQSTSFEHEQPSPSSVTHILQEHSDDYNKWCLSSAHDRLSPYHSTFVEIVVTLHRQEAGFGFRIVGGTEEGSQVSIGHIVPDGAADVDGRLQSGDEIVSVDGQNVVNSSHRHVVQLMGNAAINGHVTLGIRRLKIKEQGEASSAVKPFDVTVIRQENEGFGFVIISSINKAGSAIGRIIENSPAQRCPHLHVGDRILAVNGTNILNLHHGEIVNLIKESGYSVTLTVESSQDESHIVHVVNKEDEIGDDAQYFAVELNRGTRGFGFSIRGGLEFQNMPLFVLRIAENGSASNDGRLKIGDQIIEINGNNTKNMTHARAIEIIKQGGSTVRLLIKRGNKIPSAIDHHMPFFK